MNPRSANNRALARFGLLAAAMFGFGFALVPLYDVFCDLTGLNRDAAQALVNNTQVDYGRTVRVELLANARDEGSWRFTAPREPVRAHPGQLVRVDYQLENLTDRPLTGRAVPSYGPARAGAYFQKIDCFCFREQRLAPGEKLTLPVLFVLDRKLPADLTVVTLSYTFFRLPPGVST